MDMGDNSEELSWRGCSMKEIYRNLSEWELKHIPPVHPSDNHTVLYHWPITNFNEAPKPQKGVSKWDALHVRLPCSPKSQYPVTKTDGTVGIENRWLMIEKALLKPIKNSREFESAVLSYNSKYQNIWKFRALHKMFEEDLEEEEATMFFEDLLPKIIRLALRLPELVTTSIPLLKQGQNRSISISQQQGACLLANAFLCTFPRRNTTKKKSEYNTFPDINFNRLFQSSGRQVVEKIKCICHYFRRVCNKMPNGVLTFTRRSLTEKELPNWEECNIPLGITPLHITSCGTIEDQGQGLLQVDFANKFLGGGVLGSGCVQEEIRFVICPELIISKLFTEALKPCEALLMVGCERFSKYTGYASTFAWSGNFIDNTPFDDSGRRECHIVAIDALYFVQSSHQYREELMLRELNKAYVGFIHPLDTPAPGVASGNWGCGAFGGEASLKALIQLMACTITRRPLVYFTFGNQELRDNVHNMHTFFIENNVTVKQLWQYLKEFHGRKLSPNNLYSFIIQIHRDFKKPDQSNSSSSEANAKMLSTMRMPLVQESASKNSNCSSSNLSNSEANDKKLSPIKMPLVQENVTKNINRSSSSFKSFQKLDRTTLKNDELHSSPEEIDYFEMVEKCNSDRKTFVERVSEKLMKTPATTTKQKELLKDVDSPGHKSADITSTKTEEEKISKSAAEINKKSPVKNSNNDIESKFNSTSKNSKALLKSASDPKQRSLLDMLDVFYTERPAKRHCVVEKEKNDS